MQFGSRREGETPGNLADPIIEHLLQMHTHESTQGFLGPQEKVSKMLWVWEKDCELRHPQ